MPDNVRQRTIEILVDLSHRDIIEQVHAAVKRQIAASETPIRFAVTKSDASCWTCELATLTSEISGCGDIRFQSPFT